MSESLPDARLLARYATPAPRYTSYPTAPHFRPDFPAARWEALLEATNTAPAPPLSLYLHLPFCRHLCFYCGCTKIVTAHREQADDYVAHLGRELELLTARLDPGRPLVQLHLGGGTPTFLRARAQETLLGMLGRSFATVSPEDADYGLEADPRDIAPGTLARFHAFGFRRLSLGVQDLDPEVQAAIHRIQPEALTRRVIDEARGLGYRSVNIDLIVGLPHQNIRRFEKTLETVLDWRPERIALFHYAHLPDLFPAQRAIDPRALPESAEKYLLQARAIEKLTEAGYVHIGLDHFALPGDELVRALETGTLQRNFQGYSTRKGTTLLGAGMSAIADLGTAYGQNEKDLERWGAALHAGRLPLARGLELDPDDRVRRRVIMELMCAFTVGTPPLAERGRVPFWEYFATEREALAPLVNDGLVEIRPEAIRVTEIGRFFVRHVARVFDARDRSARDEPSAPRYSRVL